MYKYLLYKDDIYLLKYTSYYILNIFSYHFFVLGSMKLVLIKYIIFDIKIYLIIYKYAYNFLFFILSSLFYYIYLIFDFINKYLKRKGI